MFFNRARPRALEAKECEAVVLEVDANAANRRFDFVFVDANKKVAREVSFIW